MGALQGERTILSAHSGIEGEKWPTQCQPRSF